MAVVVWVDPDTAGVVVVSVLPAGSLKLIFTFTGTSTAGLNTTVQVTITSDPTGRMGLGLLLVNFIDAGAGTVIE